MPNLSEEAKYAIESRKDIIMRKVGKQNVVDRVFTVIGYSKEDNVVLYEITKKTYVNGAVNEFNSDVFEKTKLGVTSTVDEAIHNSISTLESNGFKIISPTMA